MLSMYLLMVAVFHATSAQIIGYNPGFYPFMKIVLGRPPNCGPCPPVDCRLLAPIFLGFCCGCALPIDRVPITCPANLQCPPLSPLLCGDYNYLMDCCC